MAEPLNAAVVRDRNPDLDRLAMVVKRPDGSTTRWADDEPGVDRIPLDLTFSSTVPGGDADLGCGLLRDLAFRDRDLRNRNRVRVHGPGFEKAWSGDLAKTPTSRTQVSPAATGQVGRLKGDTSLRMIPIDRDLSHWKPASARRKLSLIGANAPIKGDPQIVPSQNGQAMQLAIQDAWVSPYKPFAEAWYDAGPGLRVSNIAFITEGDSNVTFECRAGWAPDDLPTSFALSPDLYVSAVEWGNALTPITYGSTPQRFVFVQWDYPNTPAGVAGAIFQVMLRRLQVCGEDVPIQINGSEWFYGVYGHHVLEAILRKAGNGITFDAVNSTTDPWMIPHLAWLDPVTAEQAILDTNRFYRNLWGVYDEKLKWAPVESFGKRWHVRRDEGADPQSAGDDVAQEINGVIVRFDNAFTGERGVCGPPASGLVGGGGVSTAGLVVTNPDLPVNEWNERGWAVIDAGLTSEAGAVRIGEMFREGVEKASASGSVEIGAWQVFDDTGARYPAWSPSAGDRLVEDDVPGQPERLIVQASYSHAKRTASLTLDAPPDALEALQERLQVVLVGVVN